MISKDHREKGTDRCEYGEYENWKKDLKVERIERNEKYEWKERK